MALCCINSKNSINNVLSEFFASRWKLTICVIANSNATSFYLFIAICNFCIDITGE